MSEMITDSVTLKEAESLNKILMPLLQISSTKYKLAGSYRRRQKILGDLDYIVSNTNLDELLENLPKYLKVDSIIRSGSKVATTIVLFRSKRVQVEFNVVNNGSFGSALLHSTGSAEFNIGLRSHAKKLGYLLNQYGLFKDGEWVAGETEKSIFTKLRLGFISPVNRNILSTSEFSILRDKYKVTKAESLLELSGICDILRDIRLGI